MLGKLLNFNRSLAANTRCGKGEAENENWRNRPTHRRAWKAQATLGIFACPFFRWTPINMYNRNRLPDGQRHPGRSLRVLAAIIPLLALALLGCRSTVAAKSNIIAQTGLARTHITDAAGTSMIDSLDGKNLRPEWVQSLTQRGTPQTWSGDSLQNIGMPIGGIGAGQLYLGGDGRLWLWDIFNIPRATYGEHYAHPMQTASPVAQGFALNITSGGKTQTRTLDRQGFAGITFSGQYPIGTVQYKDPACPLAVTLEAFSPFVPLDPETSSLPATIMRFTVRNTSSQPVQATLAGWLQNAVCAAETERPVQRTNQIIRKGSLTFLSLTAADLPPSPAKAERPAIHFADFEGNSYGSWTATGTAFGQGPSRGNGTGQHLSNFAGTGLVNSYGATNSDAATGTLTSAAFVISRRSITFLIGGGNHPGQTCMNLLVDGKVVRSSTGDNTDALKRAAWDVGDLESKSAQLQIVDQATGDWGHIDIDDIVFTDVSSVQSSTRLQSRPDFGSMGLALFQGAGRDTGIPALPNGIPSAELFRRPKPPLRTAEATAGIIGALGRSMTLAPGAAKTITFAVTWHFPNLTIDGLHDPGGRHYASRFTDATDVADYVGTHLSAFSAQTALWRDTWYASSLPYWFLDRTFANTSSLATSAQYWLRSGRFYAWEGVGYCPGNCTHVYEYAQATARLFPSLERDQRQRIDYGTGFRPSDGMVGFRAEFDMSEATDGQAGIILRTYRENQMSPDDTFLQRNWPAVKKAMQYLIAKDPAQSGILSGAQPNTLDTTWYGQVPWISSLYIASLRAAHAMADAVGDSEFSRLTETIAERGSAAFAGAMWNGRYFQQRVDADHAAATGAGDGCEIDQVLGQSWAFQAGLPRVIDRTHTLGALDALWENNYLSDVGPYIAAHPGGRAFALPGEAGVLMCSFPLNSPQDRIASTTGWQAGYFNECMTGFEHSLASEMIYEGMTLRGLAIEKSINDRYAAGKRNPWNEVEAGDHYGRAMASYGVFLAACGYEYDGPKGYLAFAPRLTPNHFKAAFTSAEGWGSYSQEARPGHFTADIAVKYGRLKLTTLALTPALTPAPPDAEAVSGVAVSLNGRSIKSVSRTGGGRLTVTLPAGTTISTGQTLHVALTPSTKYK